MIDILTFGTYLMCGAIIVIITLSWLLFFPYLENIAYKYKNTIRWMHLISIIGLIIGLIISIVFNAS